MLLKLYPSTTTFSSFVDTSSPIPALISLLTSFWHFIKHLVVKLDFCKSRRITLPKIFLLRAFTSNPSNYTYIPLKNNSYINIFPLKTNTFSPSFQLNNIIITFFSNFHSQPLSKYIKKL
ncbi:hypothetical protein Hanom_Chr11g01061711 [Helianthus anomalus]